MDDERRIRRRDALEAVAWGSVGAVGAAAGMGALARPRTVAARDYSEPVPEASGLTAYLRESRVLLRYDDLTALAYRAAPAQKYPYFEPLAGPVTGISLTTESALPYPHHRGLWLGCEPLDGGDYWSDKPLSTGHIVSEGPEIVADEAGFVAFRDRCVWGREGARSPLRDEREFRFSVLDERRRVLDVDLRVEALVDIAISSAKHSFFALRCAPDIAPMYGGVLMNSEGGVGAEGTYGKPARWCGYHGKRRGRPDVVEGIQILDHPENAWSPCPWFAREYGHLSASPLGFLEEPWKLAKGEMLRLRYRVVLHAGTPREADIEGLWKAWVKA